MKKKKKKGSQRLRNQVYGKKNSGPYTITPLISSSNFTANGSGLYFDLGILCKADSDSTRIVKLTEQQSYQQRPSHGSTSKAAIPSSGV